MKRFLNPLKSVLLALSAFGVLSFIWYLMVSFIKPEHFIYIGLSIIVVLFIIAVHFIRNDKSFTL